jgi:hypothetical protein
MLSILKVQLSKRNITMTLSLADKIQIALDNNDSECFGELEVITEELDDVFGGCRTMACGNYRKPN